MDLGVELKNYITQMASITIEENDVVKPLPDPYLSSHANFQDTSSDAEQPHHGLSILTLNEDVFQAILSHLSYDEVAKLRMVWIQLFKRKNMLLILDVFHRFASNSIMIAKSGLTKVSLLSSGTTVSA